MPTYEYHCEKCLKNFDVFQSMKDNAFTTCPQEHCQMETWGQGAVKRQIGTGAGLIFKGSGFYITDYRSEGYKSAAQKDKPSEGSSKPAGDSGSGGKTESKPAPAAPSTPPPKPAGGGSTSA